MERSLSEIILQKQTLTNSDRVGGDLKAGLAELIALEMSRPSVRDSRTVSLIVTN